MSIKIMSLVWDNFPRGGSDKLAMLAMADWSNDLGGSLYPSIAAIARKIHTSECQARRVIHSLIDEGFLTVVGNHDGGNPKQTRQYQVCVEKLLTPSAHATPSIEATPSTHAHRPLAPMHITPSTHASQTIKEPSIEPPILLSPLQAKGDGVPKHRLNGKTAMVEQVMEYLNLQARRNYRTKNPNGSPTAGALVIAQRLKEGYTVEQCKDVIGEKSNQWMGTTEMDKYLTPQTLFRKSNFDKYLAEAEAAQQ